MASSHVRFARSLPSPARFGADALLVYDRKLDRAAPGFAQWARAFPAKLPVSAGEGLKDVRRFPALIERVVRLSREAPASSLTIVAAGGGSVGDFAGFVASVLKRGTRLAHVPSTWLAAVDSSHGGKTALNVAGGKNQIGTFHPAAETWIVESLLRAQPEALARDALAELAKIALIDGRPWTRALERGSAEPRRLLWATLPEAIESKMRVVRRDPRETTGERRILNLGHTMGHALEASLGLSHGAAVAQGLFFALEWSRDRVGLSDVAYARAQRLLRGRIGFAPLNEGRGPRGFPMTARRLRELLLLDKKRDERGRVRFVFLADWGKPVARSVAVEDAVAQAKREGWAR